MVHPLPKWKPPYDMMHLSLSFPASDVPVAQLSFGPSLNPKGIKEGDDVYFECHVRANPPARELTWRHNVSRSHHYPSSRVSYFVSTYAPLLDIWTLRDEPQ